MRSSRLIVLVACAMAAAASVVACSSSSPGITETSAPAGANTSVTDVTTPSSEARALDGLRIAVFSVSASNSFMAAEVPEIKKTAASEGAEVDVFDAAFDPQKQYSQIQDAITTGRYKAFLIAPLDGAAVASLVPSITKAGITVGAFNLPIGTDYTTTDPTTPGVAFQVLRPYSEHGRAAGDLTIKACADKSPCNVAYLYIQKGSPYDTAIRGAYDKTIAGTSSIKVIANANSQATRDGGLSAVQTLLAAHHDVDVIVGPDQSLLGAQSAIADANLSQKPLLVGFGGGKQACDAIKAGTMFGTSASLPITEGRLAIQSLAKAIASGQPVGGVDPVVEAKIPDQGEITAADVDEFKPEFDV